MFYMGKYHLQFTIIFSATCANYFIFKHHMSYNFSKIRGFSKRGDLILFYTSRLSLERNSRIRGIQQWIVSCHGGKNYYDKYNEWASFTKPFIVDQTMIVYTSINSGLPITSEEDKTNFWALELKKCWITSNFLSNPNFSPSWRKQTQTWKQHRLFSFLSISNIL